MSWDGLYKISDEERIMLEAEFSVEEVSLALSNYDGNKAPGPDGFNVNFIKAHWEEIQDDFINFIHEFHKGGSTFREINRAFIALILKVIKTETLKDYRPVCLVRSLYKVLAKVLANRLMKMMDSIIGETQMDFVSKRQITDSFVITEEILNKWKGDKEGGLLVKLDFEKAYDNVDHEFLDHVLEGMGFGEKWRGWIKEYMWYDILLDGSPLKVAFPRCFELAIK
ncbi:hypothetical protein Ddye_010241 [Dipteronia dyeriana]|uniref:Reverse transcriptase domain-containing protein n=1 Tax=Dipteronia dyeriana TaxID=168575 RepID=A0AAE0CN51_9ROSI|nr:hypothetical protein Ddye_010241 [Dipteronia dyeriana]